jgi:hypothetical protein
MARSVRMTLFWDDSGCSVAHTHGHFKTICHKPEGLMMEAVGSREKSVNIYQATSRLHSRYIFNKMF